LFKVRSNNPKVSSFGKIRSKRGGGKGIADENECGGCGEIMDGGQRRRAGGGKTRRTEF